jgi:ribulose-phosphate 3-epimerase
MIVRVAASILSADLGRLGEQVREAEDGGADLFHADIMDGHFVPSLSFGPSIIEAVHRSTALPIDAHLMVPEPTWIIDQCVEAGAASVTVHVEACTHVLRSLMHIREIGALAGVALNPGTPLSQVEWVLPEVDSVTVMTVNPGFAGQKFIASMLNKISALKDMASRLNPDVEIVVDGGINDRTARPAIEAGASVLVAGSHVFGSGDIKAAVASLRPVGTKQSSRLQRN